MWRRTTRRWFAPRDLFTGRDQPALDAAIHDPGSARANRQTALLGSRSFPQTMTHVLWAMFGMRPVGAVQPPHRHQSVAVDLFVDARSGPAVLLANLPRQ